MSVLKYLPLIMGLMITVYYLFAGNSSGSRAGAALRWGAAIISTGMMIILLALFLGQHYEFNYVFHNSGRDLPLIYRISAVWAGQEGTFLMWYWLTALMLVMLVRLGDLEQYAYAAIGLVLTIIGIFLVYSPPFAPIAPDILANIKEQIRQSMIPASYLKNGMPTDGNGLNPVLRNEWMAIHPPLIFIGYAVAAVPFALAAAGVARGDLSGWTRRGRAWTAAAWAFLGAGIFCGSYWAYIILGWGGYWAWDPVENASLLPWIATAALSHGLILQAGGKRFAQWNVSLAFFSMLMVILTTFLTRSGAMAEFSVHSFGESPLYYPILICLLAFLFFTVTAFVKAGIILKKDNASHTAPWAIRVIKWTVLMLMVTLGFVMVGTLFPLFSKIGFLDKLPVIGRAFAGEATTVEMAYYNKTTMLSMSIIGVLLAVCPFLFVKAVQGLNTRVRIIIAISGAIIGALILTLADPATKNKLFLAACYLLAGLSGAIICSNIVSAAHFYKLKKWNMAGYAIHIGVGLMILGVVASTAGSRSASLTLPQGQPVKSGDAEFIFVRAQIGAGNGSGDATVLIDLKRKEKTQTISMVFPNQMSRMSPRPAIIGKFGSDIYLIPESLENIGSMDMGADMGMPQQQQPDLERPAIPVGAIQVVKMSTVKAGAYNLKLKAWNISDKMMQEGKVGVQIIAERDGKTTEIEIPFNAMERDYKKQTKISLPDGTKLSVASINVQKGSPESEFAIVVVEKKGSSKPGPGSMLPRDMEDDQPQIILASYKVAQMPPAGQAPAADKPADKSGADEMPPSEEQMPPAEGSKEMPGGMPPGHENMMPGGTGEQGDMQMPPGHENMMPGGTGGQGDKQMPPGHENMMPGGGMGGSMPGGMPSGHGGMMGGAQGPAIVRIKIMTKPFIAFLWIGMALVTAGAFAAAFSRNKSAHSEKKENRQHDSAPDAEA